MIRRTIRRFGGVSKWKKSTITPLVDGPLHNPNLFTKDESLFTRAERVFLDLDIRLKKPTKQQPLWTTQYNLHKSVDKLLMKELKATFGAKKMKGIHIDPSTHSLVLPPKPSCTLSEWGAMSEMKQNYNSEVFKAVDRVASFLAGCYNESNKTKDDDESVMEGKVSSMTYLWMQMSDFGDGSFRLMEEDHRKFPFRGSTAPISAIPDAVVVKTLSGDLVLIVEEKAGYWRANMGHVPQVFGEMLCAMYNNYYKNTNTKANPKPKLHGIRMYNHYATFFMLRATKRQIDHVCHKKTLPPTFAKMTLQSDTVDPGCVVKPARRGRPKEEYMGWDLIDKKKRKEAQWRIAALRKILQ